MIKNDIFNLKHAYIIITLLITVLYADTVSLFFYYDDFERLRDVIAGQGNPLYAFKPIFRPGVAYFTPTFYLFFGSCYKLFGLNPVPFHLMTLITHTLNSCLVCYLAFLLSRQAVLSAVVGIVFAMSFCITDALVWAAAYADPLVSFFSLTVLILFYRYLETRRIGYYLVAVLCFILALATKISAMFIPLALISMEVFFFRFQGKSNLGILCLKYLPFVACNFIYLFIMKLFVPQLQVASVIDLNSVFTNLFMIPLLYVIPEGLLPNSPVILLLLDFLIIGTIMYLTRNILKKKMIWFGLVLLFVGILALIPVKWNFPLYPEPFNESLRHRLYLGNVGYAMFVGTLLYEMYFLSARTLMGRTVFISGISILLVLNLFCLSRIKTEFIKVGTDTEKAIKQLKTRITQLHENDRNIYIVNFPPKQGFGGSLIKLFLDEKNINIGSWPTGIPKDMPLDKLHLYLQQNGNIYDRNSNVRDIASSAWDHFYAGQFLLLTGKEDDGIEQLRLASINSLWGDVKIHKLLSKTYLKLGETAYFEKRDSTSAMRFFDLAIKSDSSDFMMMEDLALIYEASGNTQMAKTLFEKALQFENRPNFKRQIEEKLRKY